jgi:hypothetical protein
MMVYCKSFVLLKIALFVTLKRAFFLFQMSPLIPFWRQIAASGHPDILHAVFDGEIDTCLLQKTLMGFKFIRY